LLGLFLNQIYPLIISITVEETPNFLITHVCL
jgi:hypothetical protein